MILDSITSEITMLAKDLKLAIFISLKPQDLLKRK
jgi:hypothetical protein